MSYENFVCYTLKCEGKLKLDFMSLLSPICGEKAYLLILLFQRFLFQNTLFRNTYEFGPLCWIVITHTNQSNSYAVNFVVFFFSEFGNWEKHTRGIGAKLLQKVCKKIAIQSNKHFTD